MEENKKIEAQPSNENENVNVNVNVNDQFKTIEECKLHIEDQDRYIGQLEAQLQVAKSDADFYKGYGNRAQVKLTFCLQLLKLSGDDRLAAIAEKVSKAYEI